MGHESQIELWSPNLTTFCFVGFGTDRLRRQEAMKTAGRENPNHGVALPRNRAPGAASQNRSRSFKWAAKQEKFQPMETCFFLTSPFIELLRYYRAVRLPRSVRHRGTSLDFPTRPKATAALGELGISRFPSEVSAYVHGVSDRAGLWHTSRYRCTRCCLPLLLTASASRSKFLTRLNTRPARSPVNASTLPLRAAPHDSGPMWVATPLSYDFCIHYTSPVLTGAQGERKRASFHRIFSVALKSPPPPSSSRRS